MIWQLPADSSEHPVVPINPNIGPQPEMGDASEKIKYGENELKYNKLTLPN